MRIQYDDGGFGCLACFLVAAGASVVWLAVAIATGAGWPMLVVPAMLCVAAVLLFRSMVAVPDAVILPERIVGTDVVFDVTVGLPSWRWGSRRYAVRRYRCAQRHLARMRGYNRDAGTCDAGKMRIDTVCEGRYRVTVSAFEPADKTSAPSPA